MNLWHFNRNHQMTFKHDPVVQSCQSWLEVKKPCWRQYCSGKSQNANGPFEQNSQWFGFVLRMEKDPPLSVAEMCGWNWIHTSECLWNLDPGPDPEMHLSFLEQTKPAVLANPSDFSSVLTFVWTFVCVWCLLHLFIYQGCVRLDPGSPGLTHFSWLFLVHDIMSVDFPKIKDGILVLEPVYEPLPRHWHKLLADYLFSWLLGKMPSAHLVFQAISLPMNKTGFDVSDIHSVIHRQTIVYSDFIFPSEFTYSFVGREENSGCQV